MGGAGRSLNTFNKKEKRTLKENVLRLFPGWGRGVYRGTGGPWGRGGGFRGVGGGGNGFDHYPDCAVAFTCKPTKLCIFKHTQLIVCQLYLTKAAKHPPGTLGNWT